MKHRIYVDEVGNPDIDSSSNPNHRFLSLTGVIIDLEHVDKVIHPQMEELKNRYFNSHPDDPVIFHRKDMVNFAPPFHALSDESVRENFNREILDLLNKWEFTVISVCLDKKRHKDTYTTWRYDPYHYCLHVLLERYVFFLNNVGSQGDMMAESRGGKEDRRLKDSYERLWLNGTDYLSPERFQEVLTSRQLKVKPKSNNVSGLQLTDLLAHPSRNEMLEEQGLLTHTINPFGRSMIKLLQDKYYRQGDKVFGKKFI